MKLIDNILEWFRVDRVDPTESRAPYKKAAPSNVIDEMSAKYGVVDTSAKDIDILSKEIVEKRHELRSYCKLAPAGESRCKSVEDEYDDREAELKAELNVLEKLYIKVITIELNKFPLNKPCTIKYVADYIGVDNQSFLYGILIGEDIDNMMSFSYYNANNYNIRVDNISDSKVNVTMRHKGGIRYDYIYREPANNIYRIILPNWRFVKSTDSSIFYVERTA